ncbi:nuclear transport factor 2 family protein [Paraburkholderia fungorum]|uniref:nuclear transport factor 2 family protein n=1 Tax=Paraburkholderia fungorum TaxID=134537 RepID=UPI0038BD5C75
MTGAEPDAFATLMAFYEAETQYLASDGEDFSPIAKILDAECVIRQAASLPYGGIWRGHAGFEAWMKAFAQQWSSLDVVDPTFYTIDENIFSRSHVYAVAKRSGVAVDWPLLQHFVIRNGRILELSPFYWDTSLVLRALAD